MLEGAEQRVGPVVVTRHAALGKTRRFSRLIVLGCWFYAGAMVATWAAARWGSAEFWPVHLLFYGPRWVLTLPLPPLIALAWWRRSYYCGLALWVACAGFLALWGFVLPSWGHFKNENPTRPLLRLLTCNVQYSDLQVNAFATLISETQPDLVLLQECALNNPLTVLRSKGWHVRREGELLLASRFPIVDFLILRSPQNAQRVIAIRAEIHWSGQTIPIFNLHLMTPRRGLEAVLRSPIPGLASFRNVARVQQFESSLLREWISPIPDSILIGGDFNLTAEHPLYRRDWSDLANVFSKTGWGLGETMFTRRMGLRIDHILSGPDWRPVRSWVGPEVGSAHRPVLSDLSWLGNLDDSTR